MAAWPDVRRDRERSESSAAAVRQPITMRMRRPVRPDTHRSLALAAAFTCLATIACAEVRIEGNPAALRVTTDRDAVADVLSAFAATFNVQVRSAVALDAPAHAIYSGTFGQVVSRLLAGHNYVIKKDQGATEIVVLGKRGDVAVSSTPKASSPKGILSRWR